MPPVKKRAVESFKRLYHRFDGWARDLSRARYAAFVGAVSTVSYLSVGTLVGESVLIEALAMGVTLGVLFYAFDPNHRA